MKAYIRHILTWKQFDINVFTNSFNPVEVDDEYYLILFTNHSARAGYDTRSIFKRSLTGLNSEFSFS